jgi:hypothetical protein
MSFLLSGPVLFFDDDELEVLILDYSDRVRREPALQATLSRLVGNRWADAERLALSFFHASLFADRRFEVDAAWLGEAVQNLTREDVERLADILLESALTVFPLHSAANAAEVSFEFARILTEVIDAHGTQRNEKLARAHAQLCSGTRLSGF